MPLSDRIFLNKVVNNIEWDTQYKDPGKMINVSCEDGSLYQADFVLVTSSLGFLKANSDRIFIPALPAQKRRAIQVNYECVFFLNCFD